MTQNDLSKTWDLEFVFTYHDDVDDGGGGFGSDGVGGRGGRGGCGNADDSGDAGIKDNDRDGGWGMGHIGNSCGFIRRSFQFGF